MTRDLDLPVRVVVCPTVREPDGLAMSSRNVRLGPDARQHALALRHGLQEATARIASGERDAARVIEAGREAMARTGIEPEYFAIVSADKLVPLHVLAGELLIAVAARVDGVRLIDNEILTVPTT